jgi:hypothetical protein
MKDFLRRQLARITRYDPVGDRMWVEVIPRWLAFGVHRDRGLDDMLLFKIRLHRAHHGWIRR